MPFEYVQNSRNTIPFDPDKCKASVCADERGGSFHQCKRNHWKDGWCKQHHPDMIAQRDKERREKEKDRYRKSIYGLYEKVCKERDLLKTQNELLRQALGTVAPHALKLIMSEFEEK